MRADSETSHSTEAVLRERVKELTCLYGIAQVASSPQKSLEDMLDSIIRLIPPAWQYPEITYARIVLDDQVFATTDFRASGQMQTADIVIGGKPRGAVDVVYAEEKPDLYEGPFLKEERNLIDAIARKVALITEKRDIDLDRSELRGQVQHADRLATIGLLAAGVAHELNEPLGNILGFAQLAKKCPGIPASVERDIGKIEAASLHARDVIKNLLLFARQVPSEKAQLDLNQLVKEGLCFLEARCDKAGIELVYSLSPELPVITADPVQMNQVIVNLVVNALQAMPEGGKLVVRTRASDRCVSLIVEDTGVGITDDALKKIFVPFFTTKDVGEGTGLGLPVAHGIVTSHGGNIDVDSKIGCGTTFEIRLPLSTRQNGEDNS